MPRKKKAVRNNDEQETEHFVVKINDLFFLDWKGTDWTEKLVYSRKFKKANEAATCAHDVKVKYPEATVKVCRLWVGYVVTELVEV